MAEIILSNINHHFILQKNEKTDVAVKILQLLIHELQKKIMYLKRRPKEQISIYVNETKLTVSPHEKISRLKKNDFCLIHKQILMKTGEVQDYDIVDGDKITLVPIAKGPIGVVIVYNKKEHVLKLSGLCTPLSIKCLLSIQNNFMIPSQMLYYKKELLNDTKTLTDHKITNGSTVHLKLRNFNDYVQIMPVNIFLKKYLNTEEIKKEVIGKSELLLKWQDEAFGFVNQLIKPNPTFIKSMIMDEDEKNMDIDKIQKMADRDVELRLSNKYQKKMGDTEFEGVKDWMDIADEIQRTVVKEFGYENVEKGLRIYRSNLHKVKNPPFFIKYNRARRGHLKVGDIAPNLQLYTMNKILVPLFTNDKPHFVSVGAIT